MLFTTHILYQDSTNLFNSKGFQRICGEARCSHPSLRRGPRCSETLCSQRHLIERAWRTWMRFALLNVNTVWIAFNAGEKYSLSSSIHRTRHRIPTLVAFHGGVHLLQSIIWVVAPAMNSDLHIGPLDDCNCWSIQTVSYSSSSLLQRFSETVASLSRMPDGPMWNLDDRISSQ